MECTIRPVMLLEICRQVCWKKLLKMNQHLVKLEVTISGDSAEKCRIQFKMQYAVAVRFINITDLELKCLLTILLQTTRLVKAWQEMTALCVINERQLANRL